MRMTKVGGDCLKAIGHNAKASILRVRFRRDGSTWLYDGVPAKEAEAVLAANDRNEVGEVFNAVIKRRYKGRRP